VDIGERAWLMREALERARNDLTVLGSLAHIDPKQPDEWIRVEVARTLRWINRALDGLDSLTIDPSAEPPV
jgi:hypothetical protein